ncbi:MAG: hypothetical protein JXB39_17065 [Deltaproteobacteria bacterium]|nr:hypothetical protein [Deltaproteobacteria bacterium]
MGIIEQYQRLGVKDIAGHLGLHPFDVIRVLAARGPLPEDLAFEESEQERIRGESGLEVWWTPGRRLEADSVHARGVLRSMVRELVARKIVAPRATRVDNLWRGLEDEDERIARRAVNLLLQEQFLKTVSSRLGIMVTVPADKVEALERIAAGTEMPASLAALWLAS